MSITVLQLLQNYLDMFWGTSFKKLPVLSENLILKQE